MLDPRPSRNDLTSRECAKLIAAVLFSANALFGDEAVARVLRYYVEAKGPWEMFSHLERGGPDRLLIERSKRERETYFGAEMCPAAAAELVIGGLIGGLRGMAAERDLRTAVEWTAANQEKILGGIVDLLQSQYE